VLNKVEDLAVCQVLKIKNLSIMLDCGLKEKKTIEGLEQVAAFAKDSQILLLSHATIQHLGAFPYLQKRGYLTDMKVYTTSPSAKIGQISMFEYAIQNIEKDKKSPFFDMLDIEAAFEHVNLVSFNETISFKGKLALSFRWRN